MVRKPHKLLALGLGLLTCFLQVYSSWASLPSVSFLLCSCSWAGQEAAFNWKATENQPPGCHWECWAWRVREEQDTRHAGGTDIKCQEYFDEVASCDKGGSGCKRGDFKRSGAERSPYSWCWLDLTRKKVQIVVKRFPAEPWTPPSPTAWTELNFGFVFVEIFQSLSPSHDLGRTKGTWKREVNHSPLRTAITSTEPGNEPYTSHNHTFGAGNGAFCTSPEEDKK